MPSDDGPMGRRNMNAFEVEESQGEKSTYT